VIRGSTRVAAVIGDPVRHSLSPVLHNAAYAALGLDWAYVAFEVPAGGAPGALDAMRALGLAGMSVTMPHKEAVAAACDELGDDAAQLRSANTVSWAPGRRLRGDSTDGDGFVRALRAAGHDPAGARALVVGAGGAARAVALALARAGATVSLAARRPEAAAAAAGAAGAGVGVVPWPERQAASLAADLVVDATSVGMGGGDEVVVAPAPGRVYADLVYHPLDTALLRAARRCGAGAVDGLGMLVHQAALQVERWTGREAPLAEMRAAAERALGG
jgi:shikimate dehydrogenase